MAAPFDIVAFAYEVKRQLDLAEGPEGQTDEAKATSYRSALQFVHAIGDFQAAAALLSMFQTILPAAIAFTWPVEATDQSVEVYVKQLSEDTMGRIFSGYPDDPDELEDVIRDKVSAGIASDNRQIAKLLSEPFEEEADRG